MEGASGRSPDCDDAALPAGVFVPDCPVILVAQNASLKYGGEAARPLQYFRVMRRWGVDVHLVAHQRTRDELRGLLSPEDFSRTYYAPDTAAQVWLWKIGRHFPDQFRVISFDLVSHLITQINQKQIVRRLVRELGAGLVHEPIPISPKTPSVMYGLGVPVVLGPLNGDMSYPPAFRKMDGLVTRTTLAVGRALSQVVNRFLPGKLRADLVLVSNARTASALPRGMRGQVVQLVANAVDLRDWVPRQQGETSGPVRFVFLGRLVDFKMVDILLEAFAEVVRATDATLDVGGDGPELEKLKALARRLELGDRVRFRGWLGAAESAQLLRGSDVFVFPSLRECGGAVVAEAMATGLPVICAAWGGPADYASEECAVLVPPSDRAGMVCAFSREMIRLARDPEARRRMGGLARKRATSLFTWESRVRALLGLYQEVLKAEFRSPERGEATPQPVQA
jgi:glycosyltransferase involved in cell wall biosynthesis